MIKIRAISKSDAPHAVAVSGGVDSIAAAHLLNRMRFFKNLTVVHFNHKFQPINEMMEEKVREFAHDLGLPCLVGHRDVSEEIPKGESVENVLRHHRLKFFAEAFPHGEILLAHHLSDSTSSHAMNWMRGRNDECPIPIRSVMHSGKVNILRPFMLTTKEDFEVYARNNDLYKYVVSDPTNEDIKYRRNWVNKVILPEIRNHGINMETVVRKIMLKEYAKLSL